MTSKERVIAAIEGRETDVLPVHSSYNMLSNVDHWEELTGLPVWKYYEWMLSSDRAWRREVYNQFFGTLAYDIVQPNYPDISDDVEIVMQDNVPLFYNRKDGTYKPIPTNIHETGSGGGEKKIRYVFNKQDAKERLKLRKAEDLVAADNISRFSLTDFKNQFDDKFLMFGGLVNTFYGNVYHVGMENFYAMLIEEPDLIHYISSLYLEQNIEQIRAWAKLGSDAVYIDDATATSDMISVKMYEEFSLPYLLPQVKEIQRLGMKAFVIYFGGISDRVEQIASTGADVLMMEASMKGFINDYASIAKRLKGKMCLAGNLNPYTDIEITTDEELEARMTAMAKAGREYGKFFHCTGSPLTPNTTISRIKKFIELGHSL